jgi:hypothetical protein
MYFSKFRLENYKSILSSADLSFTPGFNVIVGRNDVGKTALVEGLSLTFRTIPHRSEKTIRYHGVPLPLESRSHCTIHLSGDEMRDILLVLPQFYVPVLANGNKATSDRRFHELLETGGDLTFRWEVNVIHDIQFTQYPYPATPQLEALIYKPQPGMTQIPESADGTTAVPIEHTFGYEL